MHGCLRPAKKQAPAGQYLVPAPSRQPPASMCAIAGNGIASRAAGRFAVARRKTFHAAPRGNFASGTGAFAHALIVANAAEAYPSGLIAHRHDRGTGERTRAFRTTLVQIRIAGRIVGRAVRGGDALHARVGGGVATWGRAAAVRVDRATGSARQRAGVPRVVRGEVNLARAADRGDGEGDHRRQRAEPYEAHGTLASFSASARANPCGYRPR